MAVRLTDTAWVCFGVFAQRQASISPSMLTRTALRTLDPLPDFLMSVNGMQFLLRRIQRRLIIFMLRRNTELRSPRVVTLNNCFVIVLELHDALI